MHKRAIEPYGCIAFSANRIGIFNSRAEIVERQTRWSLVKLIKPKLVFGRYSSASRRTLLDRWSGAGTRVLVRLFRVNRFREFGFVSIDSIDMNRVTNR